MKTKPKSTKAKLISAKYTYENMLESNEGFITLLKTNNYALNASVEAFNNTNKEINNLISTLNTYLGKIESGASKLSNGTKQLKNGVSTLSNKMGELNNGINTFNKQGIMKLSSMTGKVQSVSDDIKALVKLSNEYQSFSIKDKSTKSNTKFIMVIDAKKVKKEEKKKKSTKKKTSFIDRLFNLFK